jgi:hypothetical protein
MSLRAVDDIVAIFPLQRIAYRKPFSGLTIASSLRSSQ